MRKAPVYTKSKLVTEGTVLDDNKKKKWYVGKLLGQGGFGSIYTARDLSLKAFDNVIKIEPSTNGPLYTEINFYMRVCGEKEITNWMTDKKLKSLGMPRFISCGIQAEDDNRFLIMDRYGDDLHKILMRTNLSHKCLFQIAINILDVLEYIHSRDYSHADIKALNILQGYYSVKEVYLLDFGMVTKFIHNGVHKPEKPDNKLKHNGTLEFCPRDSHRGLVSCRRSDIESLMFNLVFWLTWDRNKRGPVSYGKLPWLAHMKNLGDKSPAVAVLNQVADSKEYYMLNTQLFIESVGLDNHSWSSRFATILKSVAALQYAEVPKYEEIRKQFAAIICTIDGRPTTSVTNLNAFRDIEWDNNSSGVVKNRRQSNMGTQVTPPPASRPASSSRKRPSSDNDKVSGAIKKSRKKKVLEVNNSCSPDEEYNPVSSRGVVKRGTNKRVESTKTTDNDDDTMASFSGSNTPLPDVSSIIPKSAWKSLAGVARVPGNAMKTSTPRTSAKENIIESDNGAGIAEPKVKRAAKKPILSVTPVPVIIGEIVDASTNSSISTANNVIPGVKVLERLKAKGIPTRCSPRINARQNNHPIPSGTPTTTNPRSVSCQTSPGLTFIS